MGIEKTIAAAVLELLKPDLDKIKDELKNLKSEKQDNELPRLMSLQQVADFGNITVTSVHKLCRQGKLKRLKIGRKTMFNRDEVIQFFTETARER